MNRTLLTLLLITGPLAARAQVTISPVAGVNWSCYTIPDGGSSYRARLGPCAGVLFDLGQNNNKHLQTGVLYKMNGYSRDIPFGRPGEDVDCKVHTLDVPFKLICSFNKHNDSRMFVGL